MCKGRCEVAIVCFELHSMLRNEFTVTEDYGIRTGGTMCSPNLTVTHSRRYIVRAKGKDPFKKSIKTMYDKHCVKIVMTVVAYHLHNPAPGVKSCA